MIALATTLLSFTFLTMNPLYPQRNAPTGNGLERAADWKCDDAVWTNGPDVVQKKFVGTLEADCFFKGHSGGGIAQLNAYLKNSMKDHVARIYSGPTEETYAKLPSTGYEVLVETDADGDPAQIKGNVHLATDMKTQMIDAFISTAVSGSGNASFLRGVKSIYTVETTKTGFKVHFLNSPVVQKPGFVGNNFFIKRVQANVEADITRNEKMTIPELADHT